MSSQQLTALTALRGGSQLERTMHKALDDAKSRADAQDQQDPLILHRLDDIILLLLCFLLVVDLVILDILGRALGFLKIFLGRRGQRVARIEVVCQGAEEFDRGEHVGGVEEDGEGEEGHCGGEGSVVDVLVGMCGKTGTGEGGGGLGLREDAPDGVADAGGGFGFVLFILDVGEDFEGEAGGKQADGGGL